MDLRQLIAAAIAEDQASAGDITTRAIIDPAQHGAARIVAKQALVLSGTEVIAATLAALGGADIDLLRGDGESVPAGTVVAQLTGSLHTLLGAERIILNLLMRCSGIATFTAQAVARLAGYKTRILDTRKTTPGLRALEKKAVRDGGGSNHRFGLFDGILIKDNHIAAAGSVGEAIRRAKAGAHHLLKIECEVQDLAQVDAAILAGADVLLLDNMSDELLACAVSHIAGRCTTEASGNMTLDRLRRVAETGVDFVSMGALTHSAPAADLSLKLT